MHRFAAEGLQAPSHIRAVADFPIVLEAQQADATLPGEGGGFSERGLGFVTVELFAR